MSRRTYPIALILAFTVAIPLHAEVDPALLAGMKARAIGPAGMSGRIGDIKALPEDPDLIYVGSASGGLWRSTNGGLTFDPVFDDQPVASIGAIAIAPGNPDVIWVGTGEGNPRNTASVGNGVYKSLDRGATWTHLGLDKTEKVSRVVLDPARPEVAYVAALGTTWGESPERGVFKTADGGKTWRKVLYVDGKTGAADLEMDPVNPDKLFAAMWEHRRWPWFFRSGGPGSGLHVTYDGGETWKRLGKDDGLPKGDLGRIGLAVCAGDPQVVYALVEAEESAFLRSDDGGKSFRAVNTDPDTASRPFYYADIRCDPRDPNRVYNLASRVSVSTDGGRTFDNLGGSRAIHGDYQALWIDPGDPSHLVIGSDGGVAVSRDYGATWRFVASLPLGQYYHVAVDEETPYNVYGGLQDNGSWRGPSAVNARGGFGGGAGIPSYRWQRIGFGDGFDVQPIAGDSARGYSMSQGGNLMRWDVADGGTKPIKPPEDGPEELRFNWNAALTLDPFDADTLYYGSQYVHKSTDRGRSWTIISPDLTTDNEEWQKQEESGGLTLDVTGAENFTTLVALAASPVERGVIWAGSDDGRLHVTRDGGATWTSVEANVPGVPANTWIPRIEPSRFDAAEAFVVFDDHRRVNWEPYAYRTRDYGATWTRLADGGDVAGYALVVAQDPVDRDLLFLGTEFGLWVSFDGGGKWLKWTHGVPTTSVMDLVFHPRDHDLVIGTHGRSVFILDDVSPLRELTDEVMAEPLHLFPIPAARQFLSEPTVGGNGRGHGEFEGENRPYGALLTFWLDAEGVPHPDPEVERRRQAERPAPAAAEESGERPRRGMRGGRGGRGGPEGPQAEVTVANAAGDKVRSFKTEVHLGLNRAVWDLRRDAYEQPPRDRPSFFGDRGGPELPPGTYTVTVKLKDHESTQTVEVVADPHAGLSAADWQAREAAFERVKKISADLAGVIKDIRDTRADLEVIERLARRAEDDKKDEDEPAADESDTSDESDASDESDEGPYKALHDAIKGVRESLDTLEKRLWDVPGSKGIVRRVQVDSDIGYALRSIAAIWEPPSPTDLAYLGKAETVTAEALTEWRRIADEQIAPLSEQVAASGLALLDVDEEP